MALCYNVIFVEVAFSHILNKERGGCGVGHVHVQHSSLKIITWKINAGPD